MSNAPKVRVLGVFLARGGAVVRVAYGSATYEHPHVFESATDASVFAGKVALAEQIDPTKWKKMTDASQEKS